MRWFFYEAFAVPHRYYSPVAAGEFFYLAKILSKAITLPTT
jgi:hypothetical protein